jgi:hypothetical protein
MRKDHKGKKFWILHLIKNEIRKHRVHGVKLTEFHGEKNKNERLRTRHSQIPEVTRGTQRKILSVYLCVLCVFFVPFAVNGFHFY